IVAEPHRADTVERHLDIVRGEIAQAGRHHADEAIEHHLEHRQPLVGDERAVDDRMDARLLGLAMIVAAEAEQRVDLVLVQRAVGSLGELRLVRRILVGHRRPLGGEPRLLVVLVRIFVRFRHDLARPRRRYWTSISRNSTSRISIGCTERLTRRSSSSLRRARPAEPRRSSIRSSRRYIWKLSLMRGRSFSIAARSWSGAISRLTRILRELGRLPAESRFPSGSGRAK